LRTRSAVLVVHGDWPRVEARLSIEESAWAGPASGTGQLTERRARIAVRRGARPPQRADLAWPGVHRVVDRTDREVREIRRAADDRAG
jgi:hypothetical protein